MSGVGFIQNLLVPPRPIRHCAIDVCGWFPLMQVEIEPNPNCVESELQVYNEMESPRPIRQIRVDHQGQEIWCDVVGVDGGGQFVQAYTQKINDSGGGLAYIIYGGAWGIRLRPQADTEESWDLSNPHQWGEPFKIYGSEEDIR